MSTINYHGEELTVKVSFYTANPVCMAFALFTQEHEPYCTATVFLDDTIGNDTIMPKGCAFIDTNNLPDMEEMLIEAGIAEPYKRFGEPVMGYSGFCAYPLMQFNLEKLKELDPDGYRLYEANYKGAFEKTRNKLFGDISNPFKTENEGLGLY